MTTATTKKVNRGHLLRAARKGNLWAKCNFRLTDDYAWDAADGFGKMDDFLRVYLRDPYTRPNPDQINQLYATGAPQDEIQRARDDEQRHWREFCDVQRDKACGMLMLNVDDFRSQCGHCHGNAECGNFSIHSNLNYAYEIRNGKAS